MSETKNPGTSVFAGLPDLASGALGVAVLLASDNFFAHADNMLSAHPAEWREHAFTERGKWMDGWEPRRRRAPGHDWAILRLAMPGDLVGVDINTCHFTGNHAPYARLDACRAPADATAEWLRDHADWQCVLQQRPLDPGSHNVFALHAFNGATHVRLSIYPAGGVARLHIHGRPAAPEAAAQGRIDLANVVNGGRAMACSNMYFARMDNLIMPYEAEHMGDGWETKRSPLPRQDWVILALGQAGVLDEINLHTRHFKGNYPDSAQIEALHWPDASPHDLSLSDAWQVIVPPTRLGPDRGHACPVASDESWTHLKLTILSDGGISRLRAYGVPAPHTTVDPLVRWINTADTEAVRDALLRCCGANRWVQGVLDGRPYAGETHLFGHANHLWWHLGDGDWLQAFEHHPRIGADPDALRKRFGATADWAGGEQAGVQGADEATILALSKGNKAYEAKFSHIFIVCASGLTAEQMLGHLAARQGNEPAYELRVAAGEQAKITRLRLKKLEVCT